MAELLYLAHRLPYPPNKGDKVRSYHLLKHLCQQHRVHLGTFIDDPDDEQHLPVLESICASVKAVRINPRWSKLASLRGLLTGEPLTLTYYRNASLHRWADQVVREQAVEAAVVFSACMVPYTRALPPSRVVVDFVDVDSAKWTDYAPQHRWPMSWLYAREGRQLLAFERQAAHAASHSYFATAKEAALFLAKAPECAAKVSAMSNGVDAAYFTPDAGRPTPFPPGEVPVVFTGAMDYWPNIDAVTWFAQEALPALRERHPSLRFYIVGRSPSPAVQALASSAVTVTGTVSDVRPYLQHAAVVVAPLRLARGIQNKVLEAMAMARPVVAAHDCAEALGAKPGEELLSARKIGDYVTAVEDMLGNPQRAATVGASGRERVLGSFDWAAHMRTIDNKLINACRATGRAPSGVSA